MDRPSASFTFYYLHLTNELCLRHEEKTGLRRVRFIAQTLGKYEYEIKMSWAQDDTLTGEQITDNNERLAFNFGDLDVFGSESPCYGDEF